MHVAVPEHDQTARARAAELEGGAAVPQPPVAPVAFDRTNLALFLTAWSPGPRPAWPPEVAASLLAAPRATEGALRATVMLV